MFKFYIYHPDLKTPRLLKHDPVGWNQPADRSIVRDVTLHGIFYEYTPKLQFVKDGKNLVQHFLNEYGVEAELNLIVTKRNPITKEYNQIYTGRFNLTSLKLSDIFAECNIEQTGFVQKFKNRMDVKVDLKRLETQSGKAIAPYTSESVNVDLHSKEIKKIWRTGELVPDQVTIPFADSGVRYIMFDFDDSEIDEIEQNELYPTQYSGLDPVDAKKYIKKITEAGAYQWSFDISGTMSNSPRNAHVKWMFVYGTEGNYTEHIIEDEKLYEAFETKTFLDEFNTNLVPGDEVYFFMRKEWTGDSDIEFPTIWSFQLNIECVALTSSSVSSVPLFLKHEAIARVVESITDEPDSFRSDYYGRTDSEPTEYDADGAGSLRGYTTGQLVRGFPSEGASPKMSLKEIAESCMAIDGVGFGISVDGSKQRVIAEPLSFFYKKKRIVQFPFVKNIERYVATDYLFNQVHYGYDKDKWSNEEFNNLDEFNTPREATLPITQIKKTLLLRCPHVTSGYTIEFLKRDPYSAGSTKDNDRDNDIIIIQLRRDDETLVTDRDQDFAELNNLISPGTVYNAKLSPMRNLIRNGALIRSGLYHQASKEIVMSVGEGNTEFTSRLTTEPEVVSEKRILISKLTPGLWVAEGYKFKHKPTIEQLAQIEDDPYGYIEFSKTDKDWKKGFLLRQVPEGDGGLNQYDLLKANV